MAAQRFCEWDGKPEDGSKMLLATARLTLSFVQRRSHAVQDGWTLG